MSDEQPFSFQDFGAAFMSFLKQASAQAPADRSVFVHHLRTHFNTDPAALVVVSQEFEIADRPNIHVAMEAYLNKKDRSVEILGVISDAYADATLSQLAVQDAGLWSQGPKQGPVEYVQIELDNDNVISCAHRGLYLIKDRDRRLAAYIRNASGYWRKLCVDVMAPERAAAERFLADLRN